MSGGEAARQGRMGEITRMPRAVPKDIEEVYAIYDQDRLGTRTGAVGVQSLSISADLFPSEASDKTGVPASLSLWASQVEGGVDPTKLREAIILSEILSPAMGLKHLNMKPSTEQWPSKDEPQGPAG